MGKKIPKMGIDMTAVRVATEVFWGAQWGDSDSSLADPRAKRYAIEHMAKIIRAFEAAKAATSQ